jgi:uncharacterized protein
MIVSAALTDRSNLDCDCSYPSPKPRADMAMDTLEAVVDFAVSMTPSGHTLEFGFVGGEPLLCPDLIRTGAKLVGRRCESAGIPLQIGLTTNGTLLDDEAVSLLEEHEIDLCVSIDDPPHVHPLHRRFADGTSSSKTVVANLRRALCRLDQVQVNSVFEPDSLDALPQTVAFLAALGVRMIHLNPDINAKWPVDSGCRMREAYQEVANMVVAHYRAGIPLVVNLIDSKIVLLLKDGYSADDRCGMGFTKIGFSSDGSMYPCERFMGEHQNGHCIGHVRTGADPIRLIAIQNGTGTRNPECRTCPVERFCMNWCGCINHHMSGHTDLVSPVLCASEKASMAAARTALADLAEEELFIDHLMARLHEGYHPREENRSRTASTTPSLSMIETKPGGIRGSMTGFSSRVAHPQNGTVSRGRRAP